MFERLWVVIVIFVFGNDVEVFGVCINFNV